MKKYIAQSGIIRAVNPHTLHINASDLNPFCNPLNYQYKEFEATVQSYATDLPDGEYFESGLTEPIWQFLSSKNKWIGASPLDVQGYDSWTTRQFVTAKPKEEYTPNDQRFFNHMSEEHGLTLVQSEMHEIAEVVKETYDLISRKEVVEAIEKEFPGFAGIPKKRLLTIIKNIK